MRQIRIQRSPRSQRRRTDSAPSVVVPAGPASDTSAAGDLIDRIDRLIGR